MGLLGIALSLISPMQNPLLNHVIDKAVDGFSKRGPIQMFLTDHVIPVRGSIVCCDLAGAFEHSGVYVGNGKIIHRDGDGYLDSVSPDTFLKRLSGLNPAVTIFVSCRGDTPVGGEEIACRAEKAMRDKTFAGYDLLSKNCHHFCQYCLTGKKDNGTLVTELGG